MQSRLLPRIPLRRDDVASWWYALATPPPSRWAIGCALRHDVLRLVAVDEVDSWSFLTNHARVLLCITRDPGVPLRDVAPSLGITERSAHGIVADLTAAGYLIKQKQGRRNRYQIQA